MHRIHIEAALSGPPCGPTVWGASGIRVLVVDDRELVRECIVALVRHRYSDWKFAEAANGAEALSLAADQPQLIILDVTAPRLMGIDLCRLLRRAAPDAQIVVLSCCLALPVIRKFRSAGARACIGKSESPEFFAVTLAAVLIWRKGFISSEVIAPAAADSDTASAASRTMLLSRRERDIVALLALDMTSKEIAAELKISKRTVEAYRRRIFAKLSLDSVGALTRLAIREGIV